MTELGDVLAHAQRLRSRPVELDVDYRVNAIRFRGQPCTVDTIVRLRRSAEDPPATVHADIHWSRPDVELGSLDYVVDATPLIATCSARVVGGAVVAGREGWRILLDEARGPLSFPPREWHEHHLQYPFFPYPSGRDFAIWDAVVDKESSSLLSLACRLGPEIIGSMQALGPGGSTPIEAVRPYRDVPEVCREAGIEVDGRILTYMKAFSGQCHLAIECNEGDRARVAAHAAVGALALIRHPEMPSEPLPSFISDLQESSTGCSFWFDMADAETYEGLVERVLSIVLKAMAESGLRAARVAYVDN